MVFVCELVQYQSRTRADLSYFMQMSKTIIVRKSYNGTAMHLYIVESL